MYTPTYDEIIEGAKKHGIDLSNVDRDQLKAFINYLINIGFNEGYYSGKYEESIMECPNCNVKFKII